MTYMSIFLIQDFHGKGTCDGQCAQHRYFQTQAKCALFVAINKVRQCPDPSAYRDWTSGLSSSDQYQDEQGQPPLSIGDRVVWPSDEGPEHATVKWIGFLPDSQEKGLIVGVDFVSCNLPKQIQLASLNVNSAMQCMVGLQMIDENSTSIPDFVITTHFATLFGSL